MSAPRIPADTLLGADPATIQAGDFCIDCSSHTVTLRGHEVLLSAEEFELLVYLVSHPKKLVTPSTVLATNWPGQRVRQTEFLRVLLSLRKKLEQHGSHYIRTEPWVLYSFDPHAA